MRFFFVFVFAFLLALPILHAAANDSEPPPAVPSEEGVLFCRALFANGSAAQNAAIILLARSEKSETVYRLITDSSGRFVLSLQPGSYELDSLLDYYDTPGIDFAATMQLGSPSSGNATMIFYPAGSLAIQVLEEGAPLPGASVRVNCPSGSFDYSRINGAEQFTAGEAGELLVRALPSGTCIVSASTNSLGGSSEAHVVQGEVSSVAVEVKKKAVIFDPLPFYVFAAALAIVITFLWKRKPKAAVPNEQPEPREKKKKGARCASAQEETEEGSPASRLSDSKVKAVLATLSEREREIVRFLFKCGGRAKRSQLQHKLLIPKTSLLRNLRSLERKKIVKLTPFGRNLLAEIEGWLHK